MPIDARVALLAVPSGLMLLALVAHSFRLLTARRALTFWAALALYGAARGVLVRWITEVGLASPVPYVIHRPRLVVGGVPAQEIVGWGVVAYLALWLGRRFENSDRPTNVFARLLWSSFFLGCIAFSVEAGAIAAGWWHWTVPAGRNALLGVPLIGLVDWFFVGTDLLLPFVLLGSSEVRPPWRWLSLGLFPLHFAAHLLVEPVSAAVPIAPVHFVHALLVSGLVALAVGTRMSHEHATRHEGKSSMDAIPALALAALLTDVALVEILAGAPSRLVANLPAALVLAVTLLPAVSLAAGAIALVAGALHPTFLASALPPVLGEALRRSEALSARARRAAGVAAGLVVFGVCLAAAAGAAADERALFERLKPALLARRKGDLAEAERRLRETHDDFPRSHVPIALLAEIAEKTGRLDRAATLYEETIRVKADAVDAYRHLAAIRFVQGARADAAAVSRRGLDVRPGDLELGYLLARAEGRDATPAETRAEEEGPRAVVALAALENATGDEARSRALVERGLLRWPFHRPLQRMRARQAATASR